MKLQSINRYEAYKDSGVEWLCQNIPSDWKVMRIKDLAFLQSGNSIVSEQIDVEGDFPVYGGNGLRGFYSKYTNEGSYILIGRQGALCGNINYTEGKFWASEHAVVAYLQSAVNMKWFGELLRIMNLNQYSLAAAQPGLAMDRIKRLLLPVPPFSEQQVIANYLDTETAQIDLKIGLLSQKATQYGKLKQSLINETVTRGLDKTVPIKNSGVEWIGEIPSHWEVRRVKEVGDINKSTLSEKTPASYEFDYVDIGSVTYGVKGYIKERMAFDVAPSRAKRIVQKGDTIISTVRTYLKAIATIDEEVSDLIVSTGFAVISPRKEIVDKFCSYLLTSNCIVDEICALSTGVSYPATNATVIGDLFFLIPPITEQQAIATYLDEKTAHIDRIVSTINSQIDKLKELRKTLINDVVIGKIKVV